MSTFSTTDELQVVPQGRDAQKAAKAVDLLRQALAHPRKRRRSVKLPALELPMEIVEALEAMLEEVAEGHPVVLSAPERSTRELTTTQAAEALGMSRPKLIDLLEEGEVGYRMVGTHRRIPQSEVLAYKRATAGTVNEALERRRRRLAGLRKMAEITDEAGEGY